MTSKYHPLALQALNQARASGHAFSYLRGYLGLVVTDDKLGDAYHAYGDLFTIAKKAMKEMAVMNVATVLDRQETSTGMLRLISETKLKYADLHDVCSEMTERMMRFHSVFTKAVKIRSNIIAHRSRQMNFEQVHKMAGLTDQELSGAIDEWVSVSQQLSKLLWGDTWNATVDPMESGRSLIKNIASGMIRDDHGVGRT